jgi:hypothetical protein
MKSLLITLLILGNAVSAHSSNCENFNSLKYKNCMYSAYDYGKEDWSFDVHYDVDVKITNQNDGSILFDELNRGKSSSYNLYGINEALITHREDNQAVFKNTTFKRWATCSDTELILNTEEISKYNDRLSFFYKFKNVYTVKGEKLLFKGYENGKYITTAPYPTIPSDSKEFLRVDATCDLVK